jgi:hypothetical protein
MWYGGFARHIPTTGECPFLVCVGDKLGVVRKVVVAACPYHDARCLPYVDIDTDIECFLAACFGVFVCEPERVRTDVWLFACRCRWCVSYQPIEKVCLSTRTRDVGDEFGAHLRWNTEPLFPDWLCLYVAFDGALARIVGCGSLGIKRM